MLQNLLTSELPEGGKIIGAGASAIYALIGFIVVFIGIALLVGIVWGVGKVLSVKAPAKKQEKSTPKKESAQAAPAVNDDIDEETVAVITAALAAYYQTNNPSCGFVVKRIKRI